MATRSGKTYHQETKKSRKRLVIEDTSTTDNKKDTDDNLDVSNFSNRELRSKRSSIKNSTFDKSDTNLNKNGINNSTESNWVVSDVSMKENRRESNVNTSANESVTSIVNGKKGKKIKSNLNKSTKQLRRRKSQTEDALKTDQILNTTYEKDSEKDKTLEKDEKDKTFEKEEKDKTFEKEEKDKTFEKEEKVTSTMKRKKAKEIRTYDKNEAPEMNPEDLDKDVENDLNCLNVDNTLRKQKKKKAKASKKKKQKLKMKPEVEDSPDNIKVLNTTFDNNEAIGTNIGDNLNLNSKVHVENELNSNSSYASNEILECKKTSSIDTTFDIEDKIIDTTYEKNEETVNKDLESDSPKVFNGDLKRNRSSITLYSNMNGKRSHIILKKEMSISSESLKRSQQNRRSSIRNASLIKTNTPPSLSKKILEKENTISSSPAIKRMSLRRQTVDLVNSPIQKVNTEELKCTSLSLSQSVIDKLNTTFDKEETKDNRENYKSSLISSDNSSVSRVSITSDESTENIVNTTPLLVESSIDETQVKETLEDALAPQTPLKREGTFTKEAPEVHLESPPTPTRCELVKTPNAGCTPYHISKSSQKKPMLNVTQSLEKRLSIDPGQRMTRVMFCSPVDHPNTMVSEKRKIIKSNLKGSNKSFVFDEVESASRPPRKRSYTQNDADDARSKRSRLADDLQVSVDRLSRPRTPSTTMKLGETTPKKSNTPYKSKSETKPARTRLPNFAALHQRQFDKMESLGECQERRARRARQMLTPTGPVNNYTEKSVTKETVKSKDKTDTPTKKLPTLETTRPGFTRFGFKLNLNINPFSIPPKSDKKDTTNVVSKPGPLPSLTGATMSRREVAKQTVMREKSFLEKRKTNRSDNRTFIKGVRTNRRFELQMKLRNVE